MYIQFYQRFATEDIEVFAKRINSLSETNPVYQCIVIDAKSKYYSIFTFTGEPTNQQPAQESLFNQKLQTVKQLLCLI